MLRIPPLDLSGVFHPPATLGTSHQIVEAADTA